MNIIVDDDDFPLIIKVASLPEARMQVYFLDNEDFFKRKQIFEDEDGQPFEDNPDRMVFFCKGVIETVKKFGWPPDIVHCHGWMTSLIPLYLKTAYKTEPLFQQSKVIYSVYDNELKQAFSDQFAVKASINNLTESDLGAYQNGTGVNLTKGAVKYADAIIIGSEEMPGNLAKLVEDQDKPVIKAPASEEEDYLSAYIEFYNTLLEEEVNP